MSEAGRGLGPHRQPLPSRPQGSSEHTSIQTPAPTQKALTAGASQVPLPHCWFHFSSCRSYQGPVLSPSQMTLSFLASDSSSATSLQASLGPLHQAGFPALPPQAKCWLGALRGLY